MQNAATAYSMGVGLGFASYQASVRQMVLAENAIKGAQHEANELSNAKLLGKVDILKDARVTPKMHDNLVNARQKYERSIRQKSNAGGNAYKLGLFLGLAEAQCTSPHWEEAKTHAREALRGADQLIKSSGLSKLAFDHKLLEDTFNLASNTPFPHAKEDALKKARKLRQSYGDVILVSDL